MILVRKFILPFLIVYLYIFGVLLNYENTWMHTETIYRTAQFFRENTTTQERWAQVFNWHLWEGDFDGRPCARARFLSHVLELANTLFRNWLFRYIPPHPSLSITWIFTLVLSPYFLYRLMRNLLNEKKTGLITALIYLALPGTLIPIMMLFHAGKPMSNFLYILCLYLGSQLYKNFNTLSPPLFKREFLFLALTILSALFFDEYCLFIWILIPIFYPRLFTGPCRLYVYGIYGLIPLLYFLSVVYLLPKTYAILGYPGFNFLSFIDINRGFPALSPFPALVNFVLLLHDNLQAGFSVYLKNNALPVTFTKFLSVTNHLKHTDNIRFGLSLLNEKPVSFWQVIHNGLTLTLGVFFFLAFRRTDKNDAGRACFIKSTLALVAYAIFFSYLHISNNIISGCGWYGCNFSVLFAIWIGSILHITLRSFPKNKIIVYLFLTTLIGHALWNTQLLNHAWMILHRHTDKFSQTGLWLNQVSRKELYKKHYIPKKKNNFELTLQAWQNRHDPLTARMILNDATPEVRTYLYAELPYIK